MSLRDKSWPTIGRLVDLLQNHFSSLCLKVSDAFEISLEKFSGRRFVVASRDEAIERSDTKKINKNNCQAYGGTIGLDGRQQCARARAKTLNAQARPGR